MWKWLSYILIFPIKVYQFTLSPLLGRQCRFHPTCSAYAIEALKEWGPFKGTFLAVKRIVKCHPWGPWGDDPVPKKEK